MAALTIRNLYKRFGKNVETLKNVNIAINSGEFMVFVGPSGCGKSTLMNMIAGLEEVSAGDILIDAPGTVEAYEFMASLVHEHKVVSPDGVTKENNGRDAFLAGKVGMMTNSTGNYGSAASSLGDDLAVLPMPCNKVCSVPIGGAGGTTGSRALRGR